MNNSPIRALAIGSDNARDIYAAREFECFQFDTQALDRNFGLVIVFPATYVKCKLVAYGDAASGIEKVTIAKDWPGKSGPYKWQVKMTNIKFTTRPRVEAALFDKGAWSYSPRTFLVTVVNEYSLRPIGNELDVALRQLRVERLNNL
jgi:hypothetical protein